MTLSRPHAGWVGGQVTGELHPEINSSLPVFMLVSKFQFLLPSRSQAAYLGRLVSCVHPVVGKTEVKVTSKIATQKTTREQESWGRTRRRSPASSEKMCCVSSLRQILGLSLHRYNSDMCF